MPQPDRERRTDGLVELVTAESAAEAARLAARLQKLGIAAIANAEEVRPDPRQVGRVPPLSYRSFVLVAAADHERARAAIYAEQRPEGEATFDEIRVALEDGDDGYDDDEEEDEGDEDAEELPKSTTKRVVEAMLRWIVLLGVLAAITIVVCCVLGAFFK